MPATSGPDILTGSPSPDFIHALGGNDFVYGLEGDDNLFGDAGHDTLYGGGSNDRLIGGIGNDKLNGGAGIDTADYSSGVLKGKAFFGAKAGVSVNLTLAGAQNTGGGGGIDTLVSIENLTGSNFTDTLTGNGANNVLSGLGGHDLLIGGNGNDTLTGGAGNDVLNGGTGSDTADYGTATAGVIVNLDLENTPQNTGGAGIDTLVSIENLTGSKFNDSLNTVLYDPSGTLRSTLNGGDGNDVLSSEFSFKATLNGDGGNDVLFSSTTSFGTLNGGDGNDVLGAGDGSYTLNGGAGNDELTVDSFFLSDSTLNGGAGADTLEHSGGPSDPGVTVTFDYNAVSDSLAGTGKDTITGFSGVSGFDGENEDGDQIDLSTIDARPSVAGNQAFIWGGPFTEGHLRYVGGVVQGNLDGNASPEFEIQLVGTPALFVQAGHPGTDILL